MSSSDQSNSNSQPTSSDSNSDNLHTGYEFESGYLCRAREWTDLFPWLRLIRVMRVAGSPPLVAIVAITLAVWLPVHLHLCTDSVGLDLPTTQSQTVSHGAKLRSLPAFLSQMIPTQAIAISEHSTWWQPCLAIIWALLIWLPTVLLLLRQGGLLTAGRPMMSVNEAFKLSIRRAPYAWVTAIVPVGCVLILCVGLVVLGWASRMGEWIAYPLCVVAVMIAIASGLLGFGANIAVPLGWAALVNEKEPDPLDSLSRGYEYLYRRPLHMLIHTTVAMLIICVITYLANLVAGTASHVSTRALSVSGASETMIDATNSCLAWFPLVIAITLGWSLVGGIYLIMRWDTNGQEVEDIWQPPLRTDTPLPKLPS